MGIGNRWWMFLWADWVHNTWFEKSPFIFHKSDLTRHILCSNWLIVFVGDLWVDCNSALRSLRCYSLHKKMNYIPKVRTNTFLIFVSFYKLCRFFPLLPWRCFVKMTPDVWQTQQCRQNQQSAMWFSAPSSFLSPGSLWRKSKQSHRCRNAMNAWLASFMVCTCVFIILVICGEYKGDGAEASYWVNNRL